ncbi:MAG: hypothetical protein QOI04_221 [Verrucomicrobiota bacterium]
MKNARFLEDLKVGDRFQSGTFTATEKDIIDFARQFDPQPFHVDPAAAKKSIFGGLVASGWHTAAIAMRLYVTSDLNLDGGSIGLSVNDLEWPNPVRPGDTLQAEIEILSVRPSRSKPDRGVVEFRNITKNQNGDVVITWKALALVRTRAARST